MADTAIAITAGTGTNVDTRTEATNGNHRQVIVIGDPSTNAGVAPVDATNGLSVTLTTALPAGTAAIGKLAANSGVDIGDVDVTSCALPTGAATAAKQPALGTAGTASADVITVQGIASMTNLAVDIKGYAGAGIPPVGNGTTSVTTPRFTLASDSTGQVTLAAGTAAIGKLAANSGVDIGDVDILSIAAGDNNIGNVDLASAIPAGTNNIGDVDVLTVPADPFGANADAAATAGSTGSIQAKLRLITSQLDSIKTAVETLDNTVGGTELQVDVVGALPAGTNAIGKLAANSGVDIGDTDVTSIVPGTGATNLGKAEDAGHSTGDTGVMALGVRTDVPNAVGAGTTADYSFLATDMAGGVRTALYETDFAVLGTNHVKKYYTNAGAVTDGIIWSPAAGKRWYVTDLIINVSAAATVTLEDDLTAGDAAVMKFELAANSGISHHFQTPLFSGEDAADLIITTSAGNVYVTVTGYEI